MSISSRTLLATAAFWAAATVCAQAQPYRTSFGPTTAVIGPGHAAHTSLPKKFFWGDEQLEVDVFGMPGPTAGLRLLTSGKIDFVHLDIEALMVAHSQGVKIKAVAVHTRHPFYRLVVQKSSGITDLKQLRGKTVGQPESERVLPYFRGTLAEAGLDIDKDVKVIATGVGAPAALAFRRGEIAAWFAGDVNIAPLENRGLEFIEFKPSYYDKLLGTAIVTREEMIEKNPEIVARLVRGVAKSVIFGLENPEAAIHAHWDVFPQTKPQDLDTSSTALKEALHIYNSRFQRYKLEPGQPYGSWQPEQLKQTADSLKKSGALPADYDPATAFTDRFIKQINDFDREAVIAKAKAWRRQ